MPGDGEGARRLLGLLDDADDAVVAVELGHAEVAQVLGILLAREQDPRAALLRARSSRPSARIECSTTLSASITHDAVAADEPLGEAERLGDPARVLLVGVREPVDPPLVPVAEQAEELARRACRR